MPRIPEYKLQQVNARPIDPSYQRGAGASLDAFGGASARGLQQFGQGLEQASRVPDELALRQMAEDNARYSKDLDNKLATRTREYFYGEGGFYSRKGEDAIAASANVGTDLEKIRSEVLAEAPNERVRKNFDLASTARINQDLESSSRYTLQQRQVAMATTSEVRIKEAWDDASAAYNDDKILARSQAIIDSEVAELAEINGWSPEVQMSKMQEARTAMYKGAITSAIKNDQVDVARRIFDKYKSQIDGVERADIARDLASQGKLASVQKATDEIMAGGGSFQDQLVRARAIKDPDIRQGVEQMVSSRQSEQGQLYNLERLLNTAERQATVQDETDKIVGSGLSPEDQLVAARTIEDPEIRNAVEQEVKNRISEKNQIAEQAMREYSREAFSAIYAGTSLADWAKANPDQYQMLTGNGELMASFARAEEAFAEGKLFAAATDGTTLSTLQRMASVELANVNPEQYRADLTQTEYSKLNTLVAGAQERVKGVRENFAVFERGDSYLKKAAPDDLNWGKDKQSEEKQQIQRDAQNQMDAFINDYVERGVLPTAKELQEEANRLMSPVVNDIERTNPLSKVWGFIVGNTDENYGAQVARMTPSQRATVKVPYDVIRPASIAEAEEKFKAYGVEPTKDALENFFGAELANDSMRQKRILGLVDSTEVSQNYVNKVSLVESGNRPNAKAKTSTATGLFQFTNSTWLNSVSQFAPEMAEGKSTTEVLDMRKDPKASTEMFKKLTAQSGTVLQKNGLPTTDANLYLAHFAGPATATKALKASDDTPLEQVFSPSQIKANAFLAGKNVGWLKSWSRKKMAV